MKKVWLFLKTRLLTRICGGFLANRVYQVVCVPGDVKKPCNLIPRQQPIPEGKHGDKGKTEGLFAHIPGNVFNPNAMLWTSEPSRTVVKKHWNAQR